MLCAQVGCDVIFIVSWLVNQVWFIHKAYLSLKYGTTRLTDENLSDATGAIHRDSNVYRDPIAAGEYEQQRHGSML